MTRSIDVRDSLFSLSKYGEITWVVDQIGKQELEGPGERILWSHQGIRDRDGKSRDSAQPIR